MAYRLRRAAGKWRAGCVVHNGGVHGAGCRSGVCVFLPQPGRFLFLLDLPRRSLVALASCSPVLPARRCPPNCIYAAFVAGKAVLPAGWRSGSARDITADKFMVCVPCRCGLMRQQGQRITCGERRAGALHMIRVYATHGRPLGMAARWLGRDGHVTTLRSSCI